MESVEFLKRKFLDLRNRVLHEKASPEFIARGWSVGVFIGFAIPFGVQLYLAIPLALLMKGSKLGATIGTLVSNPFTMVFLYPAQCWVGSRIIGSDISWAKIVHQLSIVFKDQDFHALSTLSGHLVTSFFVGGLLFAVFAAPITYFCVLNFVRTGRLRIRAYKIKKAGAAMQNAVETNDESV